MSEPYPTVWFRRAVTEVALEKGDIVVATTRQPNSLDDLSQRYPMVRLRILVLPLDITLPDKIANPFAEAERAFGSIDVVFNNAGFGHIGELEAMENATARALFETNFWGAIRIARAAGGHTVLSRDKSPGSGRAAALLQMSSYAGLVGVPGASFYGASKFALEGASESIAAELDPAWNIKVTIIEPGRIRTKLMNNAAWSPEHPPAYQNSNLAFTHVRRFGWDKATPWKDATRTQRRYTRWRAYRTRLCTFCSARMPSRERERVRFDRMTRKKIVGLVADIDAYEPVSEGLEG